MTEMKFNDVLRRARLNRSTAHYVLKSRAMPDTPPGDRGRHRVFSFDQAFGFATATLLVMGGVPLRKAVAAVELCVRHLKAPDGPPFWLAVHPATGRPLPVRVQVWGDEILRLEQPGCGETPRRRVYLSLSRGEAVDARSCPPPISCCQIDLARLARVLDGA